MDKASLAYESIPAETSEGYKLNMFRIKDLKTGGKAVKDQPRGPILLIGDVNEDATSWLDNSATDSTPYKLYLEGYDVYFYNRRGTKPSRLFKDATRNADDDATNVLYWDFS
jgi:pimeloyl-ACP methyl ester carboxylesterase